MSLLTVGTVAFDTVETRFGKAERIIGGACTYISWAASYFTDQINLVSVVGDDFPQAELDAMAERGVNLDGLQIKQGEKSFFWEGKYHDDMNDRDTLVTDLNVLADFDPVLPSSYTDSDYIMLGNLTPQVQARVLDQLTSKPKLIALDTMNFWMDIALEDLLAVIKRIDLLTINDQEARQLSGEYSLLKAAHKIMTMGPKTLVIKKGEHGALLFQGEKIFFVPALPLEDVNDPTGAGDTFAGGMMGYLAGTDDTSFENMKRAIVCGSALASCCVEEFGITNLKKLKFSDIRARVDQFKALVNFDAELAETL